MSLSNKGNNTACSNYGLVYMLDAIYFLVTDPPGTSSQARNRRSHWKHEVAKATSPGLTDKKLMDVAKITVSQDGPENAIAELRQISQRGNSVVPSDAIVVCLEEAMRKGCEGAVAETVEEMAAKFETQLTYLGHDALIKAFASSANACGPTASPMSPMHSIARARSMRFSLHRGAARTCLVSGMNVA